MAPLSALAVHLAEHVMQQHVRRPGRVGTREVADDRVEAERRLDRRRLEPAVEHVARALREEVEHVAPLREVERRTKAACATFHASSIAPRSRARRRDVRRRREQQLAQHVGDAVEHRVVRGQPLGVARANARDLRLRRREPAADLEVPRRPAAAGSSRTAARRSRSPCSASCRSRITCGSSRLTV